MATAAESQREAMRESTAATYTAISAGEHKETERVLAELDSVVALMCERGLIQTSTQDKAAEAIYDVLYNDVRPEAV